jgi:aminoglycoside 6'-N-acetyltransferase
MLFNRYHTKVRLLLDEDAPMLVKWLSDPVVLEFYEGRDRPHDLALVRKHFYNGEPGITRCVVVHEETDIGYIQFYVITEEERVEYGYSGFNGSIYGLDQFIGEPDYWNCGIGTELIAGTVHYLLNEQEASKIVMDPRTDNLRAVRVYEKNGFVIKKRLPKREWHEGELRDCWLMEYEGGTNNQ